MRSPLRFVSPGLSLALLLAACSTSTGDTAVARAGEHVLTVDQAANLVSSVPSLPANAASVGAVVGLWVDYASLAEALRIDSTLSQLDLHLAVRAQIEQELIMGLRQRVITPDTVITEPELREAYDRRNPELSVRLRHIVFNVSAGASATERDSIRGLAEEALRRLRGGADFRELAAEVSDDTVSAARGGDLGYFTRAGLSAPFADVAFALEPGEFSDPVKGPVGLHILQIDEKRVPSLDDLRGDLRQQILRGRYQRAESLYVATLEREANVELEPEAIDLVRQLTRSPSSAYASDVSDDRTLVRYDSGEVSVLELREVLATREDVYRARLAGAEDEILRGELAGLARRELLLARAEAADLDIETPSPDSLAMRMRSALRALGDSLGLSGLVAESADGAVESVVLEGLREERALGRLGTLGPVLRRAAGAALEPTRFAQVIRRVAEQRALTTGQGDVGR